MVYDVGVVEKLIGLVVPEAELRRVYASFRVAKRPVSALSRSLSTLPKSRTFLLLPVPEGESAELVYHDRILKKVIVSGGAFSPAEWNGRSSYVVKPKLFPAIQKRQNCVLIEHFFGYLTPSGFVVRDYYRKDVSGDQAVCRVNLRTDQLLYAVRYYAALGELELHCQYGARNTLSPTLYRAVNKRDIPMQKSKHIWWDFWSSKAMLYFGHDESRGMTTSQLTKEAEDVIEVCREHSIYDPVGYLLLANDFGADTRPYLFVE